MATRNTSAVLFTVLVLAGHTAAHARSGEPEIIHPPADVTVDFAIRFPQGTVLKFGYDLQHKSETLNRNSVFFCPQTGNELPRICYQQFEQGSSSRSTRNRYFDYSNHMEQPPVQPGAPYRQSGMNLDFDHNKFTMTCPAMTETDGPQAAARNLEGANYAPADKARLQQGIRSGAIRLVSLPETEELIGVFKTPGDEDIIVTFPKYTFTTEGIGYYRGVGDLQRYPVTSYSESSGYRMQVTGQGTLRIPFDYFNEGKPVTLTSENGIVTPLRRVDMNHLPQHITGDFGTPRHPSGQRPYETPCAAANGPGS